MSNNNREINPVNVADAARRSAERILTGEEQAEIRLSSRAVGGIPVICLEVRSEAGFPGEVQVTEEMVQKCRDAADFGAEYQLLIDEVADQIVEIARAATTFDQSRLETKCAKVSEAEAWKSFWEQIAVMWMELPREIQLEYTQKYPRGPERKRNESDTKE